MNLFKSLKSVGHRASIAWKAFTLTDSDSDIVMYSPTASGVTVTPEQARRQSTVFSCVRLLSDSVAMLPSTLYNIDRQENSKTQAFQNPLYNVLMLAPNEWMTAYDYWKWNMECMLYRGKFISWKNVSSNGKVLELIPIHPDSVTIDQRSDGMLLISGKGKWGKDKYFNFDKRPASEFFIVNYATTNTVDAVSPIAYNRETIGTAIAMQNHGSYVFKNGAKISGYFTMPGKLGLETRKTLEEGLKKAYSGSGTGGTPVLDNGMEFKKISMSNADAQYLEARQFTKEEISGGIFGVPPHMIGDTKQAKGWSTIEQQGIDYVTYSLNPYLERIEQAAKKQLIPKSEWKKTDVIFNVNKLLRGDSRARADYFQKLWMMGSMSPNEIRVLEGMNPREGGDEYLRPANMLIDSEDGQKIEIQQPTQTSEGENETQV